MSEDSISKIFRKLDDLTSDVSDIKTSVASIGTKLQYFETNAVTEAAMMKFVDAKLEKGIDNHAKNCRPFEEATGRIDVPNRGAVIHAADPVDKNSGTVRISISGLPPALRWLLYVAVPTAIGFGGYQFGGMGDDDNQRPAHVRTNDNEVKK